MRGKGYIFVISVLISFYIANRFGGWQWIGLCWLILLLIWYKQKVLTLSYLLLSLLIVLFFSQHFILNRSIDSFEEGRHMTLTGQVTQITKATNDYTLFTIDEANSKEKIQVSDFSGRNPNIKVGATCTVTGKVEQPKQATNPGQFNYQTYLSQQSIYHQIAINQSDELSCEGSSAIGNILSIRDQQLLHLANKLSTGTAPWVQSLVLGDRTAIDDEILSLFQRWHLSHLLSISGLHVSIVVMILHFTFIHILKLTKETTYQLLILFLLLYPFLAGGAPSIWRASLVSSMNYLAWYYRHRIQSIDFLSLSFILLLLIKPEWIHHLGFQFSYLLTFAILLSKQIFKSIKHPLLSSLFISGLSALITFPIQVHNFFQFNPLSFILNTFVALYFSLFLIPISFFTYLISMIFPPLMYVFDMLIQWINEPFLFILQKIDQFFYVSIVTGALSPLFIVLFYIVIFYLLTQFEQGKIRRMVYAFLSFLIILFSHQFLPYLNPNGKVTVLDIGQAAALVIELPYRRGVILYDVGATIGADFRTISDSAYEQTIKPYLHHSGIKSIDAVILSHEDSDHIGSLPHLISDFNVQLIMTSPFFQWPESEVFLQQISSIDQKIISYGQSFHIADQLFHVLGPDRDWRNPNDNSLVLYTIFNDRSWILTGDISERVEKELIKRFSHLQIDVLSVAHHGSATSTSDTFLRTFTPSVALISVGRNNYFKHPNEEVIYRLKAHDIRIYRTDENGAIQFTFQNGRHSGTFFPFIP